MNILIVEDDPFVSKDIQEKLKQIGYSKIEIAATYEGAIEMLEQLKPDIILVDIDLGEEKNGIDLGHVLTQREIPFIYLSDMQDPVTFAKARETKPVANLDKPVSSITLRNMIDLAFTANFNSTDQYLVIPSGSKKVKIESESILYLKAAKNNCEIYLVGKKPKRYLSSTPMGNVYRILNDSRFCQVHRSYVINLKRVHAFQGNRVFMDEDLTIEIPISPSFMPDFKSRFQAL